MKNMLCIIIIFFLSACSSDKKMKDPRNLSLQTPKLINVAGCNKKGKIRAISGRDAFLCRNMKDNNVITTTLEVDNNFLLTEIRSEIRANKEAYLKSADSKANKTLKYLVANYTSTTKHDLDVALDDCQQKKTLAKLVKDGGEYTAKLICKKLKYQSGIFLDLIVSFKKYS